MQLKQAKNQDQRILVLVLAALCICLFHFSQLNPKEESQPGDSKKNNNTLVWLSGQVPAGFYFLPGAGITHKDLYSALKLPVSSDNEFSKERFQPEYAKNYSIEKGQIIETALAPSRAVPFFYLPISLNKADPELLATLPGIGEKLAQNIVDYRMRVGQFSSLEEIMKVAGVGEKKFENIKKLLSL